MRQEEPGWLMSRWAWGQGLLPLLAAPCPHPALSASPDPILNPGPSPKQKAERQPRSTWPAGTTGAPSSCLAIWPALARHGRCPFLQLWSWGWQEQHQDSRRAGPRACSPPDPCPSLTVLSYLPGRILPEGRGGDMQPSWVTSLPPGPTACHGCRKDPKAVVFRSEQRAGPAFTLRPCTAQCPQPAQHPGLGSAQEGHSAGQVGQGP